MKNNDSKALARIKRIYQSGKDWYMNKVNVMCNRMTEDTEKCESITDFTKKSKYAKLLKYTNVPFRSKMGQIEQHRKNKKSRVEAQQQIQDGLREWDEIFEDTPTCDYCSHFNDQMCKLHCVPKFSDDLICGDFRD